MTLKLSSINLALHRPHVRRFSSFGVCLLFALGVSLLTSCSKKEDDKAITISEAQKKFEAKWKFKQASGWRRAFTVALSATKNEQGEVEALKMQVRRHADLFLGDTGMLHSEQSCKLSR